MIGETERCCGMTNSRLEGRSYFAGDKFTGTDIAAWCFIRFSAFSGVGLDLSK